MGLGDGSPPAARFRGGAMVGVWERSPQKPDIYKTICSCQMLFYASLLPSPSSIPLPLPPKTAGICANPMGMVGTLPTRGYATDENYK